MMNININITIDDRIIVFFRKVFTTKILIFFLASCLFAGGLFIFSEPIAKPYTFESSKVISSAEVNLNFDRLYTKTNELDSQVRGLEETIPSPWTGDESSVYYMGNVGIGTSTPLKKLHIKGSSNVIVVEGYVSTANAITTLNSMPNNSYLIGGPDSNAAFFFYWKNASGIKYYTTLSGSVLD